MAYVQQLQGGSRLHFVRLGWTGPNASRTRTRSGVLDEEGKGESKNDGEEYGV